MQTKTSPILIKNLFRGFLPVIVDVETSGIDPTKHAILEMCIVLIDCDVYGKLTIKQHYFEHFLPFAAAELDQKSLKFNQIDPYEPLRFALEETLALDNLFKSIRQAIKTHNCQRAVLVGHNAWFDLLFVNAAAKRTGIKSPFHTFTSFDTATLAGVHYGQTVLAKALRCADIEFDMQEAHSAIYDALKTAELFCKIYNSSKIS